MDKVRKRDTSCSALVRAPVCQPRGPGLIPGMSRSETAGKPDHAAATHHIFGYYMIIKKNYNCEENNSLLRVVLFLILNIMNSTHI